MRFFKFKLSVFFNFEVKSSDLLLKLNVLKLILIINYALYFFIRKLNIFIYKINNMTRFFFSKLILMLNF